MTRIYDLAVIGGGSAGLLAAPLAAKLGVKVALIEKDRPGGDCLYTGCVPSKALLRVAKAAHEIRTAGRLGLTAAPPAVDMARVSAHIQEVISRIYVHESPESLRAMGVDVILGAARFVDAQSVQAGGRLVRARRFLICTGSRPAVPPIPGLADVPHLTYEDLFSLTELPGRLLVAGGGPIGVEMGQAFRRLGSQVTLVQRGPRLLRNADPDCASILAGVLRSEGIDLRFG
ncbi:MAG: FAD-dependent oxidoreductase, partial [Chloroflexota bacterium]